MNLKLTSTKAITAAIAAAGILAGMTFSAPGAEAGMRIHFGFPIGSFNARGGGHHRHAHKYHHARRHHELRRAQAIEAARARKAAAAAERAERRRAAALAAAAEAKRKAAAQRAAAEQAELEAAKVAQIPPPVKKPDLPAKATETAALDTAALGATDEPRRVDEEPAKLECKRYFANVGMTITVPCTE